LIRTFTITLVISNLGLCHSSNFPKRETALYIFQLWNLQSFYYIFYFI
jgi:hypothetical protein